MVACWKGTLKVVVSWALGLCEGVWCLLHYIHKIRDLIRVVGVVLSHICRCQNGVADSLVKWGRE